MVRFLIRVAIFLGTAALGLVVAAWLIHDVGLSPSGFIVAIIVFAIAQGVLAPFILKIAHRYAPAMLGGIGLVSTFIALLVASLFPGGLTISSFLGWVFATLVVWLVTALGGWILPLIFLKKRVDARRS